MNAIRLTLVAAALSALVACSSTTEKTCADFCGAGNVCSDGQCVPLACSPACGAGTACQMGQCVPVQAVTCAEAYPGCAACDTSAATPAWVGQCGAGTTCGAGDACVPLACSPTCGAGTACQMGECVPVQAITCADPYPGCAACDTSGATPAWVGQCGAGTTCSAGTDACVSTATLHASFGAVGGPLRGPFANGYAVTAQCVGCHPAAATEVMASTHWTWAGPTPDLVSMTDLTTVIDPGTIGKSKLINNFCVATPSNDKRCDQCHAGYGGDPVAAKPQKSARNYASADPTTGDSSIPLENRIDCLVCHSNPVAAYAKDPKNFGNPVATLNLAVAAQDIVKPTRTNCGACHFYAGGGDNVKLMGSSLKNPSEAIDVHMGRGMECLDCHAGPEHTFKGSGVHVPTHSARVSCADCHGAAPHEGKVQAGGENLDSHAQKIACQTCHIPRFSRGQFGKVDWDWSTAGDNTTCAGGVPCSAGVTTTKVNDDGTPNPASLSSVVTYDYIKGNFTWQKNIVPGYRWSNGKSTHALTTDKGDFGALGTTAADANRITLGEPVGAYADGKIMAFKVMRGRQAFYIDGANSYAIVPNVFGAGSLWGVIQAVGYSYVSYDFDGAAGPITPGADSMAALWGKVLATGAVAAGQASAVTSFPKYDGVTPGYDWRYTKLYMDLNHEVAPKATALGANNACADCHSGTGNKLPLCELYAGQAIKPWGVTCP